MGNAQIVILKHIDNYNIFIITNINVVLCQVYIIFPRQVETLTITIIESI